MLLDAVMPRWDISDRHDIVVRSERAATYAAIRRCDLARSPISRLLFALRNPLASLRGRLPARLTLDDVVRTGFVVLGEEPGREIVLGVAGRFWAFSGGRTRIAAGDFAQHAAPGTAKAAMSFWIEPLAPGRCRVVTETRVLCADDRARGAFGAYWRFVRPGSALIRRAALAQIKREAEAAHGAC